MCAAEGRRTKIERGVSRDEEVGEGGTLILAKRVAWRGIGGTRVMMGSGVRRTSVVLMTSFSEGQPRGKVAEGQVPGEMERTSGTSWTDDMVISEGLGVLDLRRAEKSRRRRFSILHDR